MSRTITPLLSSLPRQPVQSILFSTYLKDPVRLYYLSLAKAEASPVLMLGRFPTCLTTCHLHLLISNIKGEIRVKKRGGSGVYLT